jgi:WD40 repeat protein/transcriptional regulator with XRE-family HTH domain
MRYISDDQGRDVVFGQIMMTLRTALGLTQSELANLLGVSRRAIGGWETGGSYPKTNHLKHLITIGVQRQIFSAGRQEEEIRQLWKAAHQKVLLDEQWLAALLHLSHPNTPPRSHQAQPIVQTHKETNVVLAEKGQTPTQRCFAQPQPGARPLIDWGEALTVPTFYGREQELAQLVQWIRQERCRVVGVLGLGGIGKSALSITLMQYVTESFDAVLFRSLRDAPSCEVLLDDCLQALSPQSLDPILTSLERRISLLQDLMHTMRILLVLDNLEVLLDERETQGRFRPGFEGYNLLLRRVAETTHQSCLLLTSREKPAAMRTLEGKHAPVHSLRLSGLAITACQQLFAEKEVIGTPQEQAVLATLYGGNPLALKIVVETITDLFAGHIGQFLAEEAMVIGTISHLLDEQFSRLSPLEQTILLWLAIAREPVTLDELQTMLITPLHGGQVLEAVDSLRRRSLIELGQRQASFTLQAVVLEYATALLIEEAVREIQQQELEHLLKYSLVQAQAKEYVRQTQQRLIVAPMLTQLRTTYSQRGALEAHLIMLLDQLREWKEDAQGYGPANLIALLRELRDHLRQLNLSQLSIRGAYLQGVEMQDTSLAEASIRDTIFTEAFDAIWAVAVSCQGQYWAAGSQQGEVRIWREEGRLLHRVWQAHTDNAYALTFSPDERTLATASWDGTVKLWDLEQGALLWTRQHLDTIRAAAFSPTGHLLATGSDDGMIHLWNPASGALVQTVTDECGAVYALAWSPDGHLLANSSFDGSIRLWQIQDTQAATCVQILSGHTNWIFRLAFAPDGTSLASGSWDQTVKLWDVTNGRLLHTLTGHTDRVQTIAWSPDGRTIASAGMDNIIRLWDVEQSSCRAMLQGHTAAVYTLAFTSESRRLLSGSEDGTLGVWEVEKGHCVHIIQGYAVALCNVAWNPIGTHLATAGSDRLVLIWDATNQTPPRVLHGHQWAVFGVAWSPDGRLLASSGRDNAIRLWDPITGTCLQTLRDPDYADTILFGVAWSPDGRLLASGSSMRGVQVWDMETGQRCWVGATHPTRIRSVAWSPDSSRLVSTGYDGSLCLWKACDGTLLQRWQHHQSTVVCVAWSPNGERIASGGGGRGGEELFVWDADSGQILRSFTGKPGSVFALTWSKDGKTLITGRNDGSLCWWDVDTWKLLHILQSHQQTIHAVQVSPDGHLVACCGDDGTIKLWGMETTELVRTLRRDRPYERLNITDIKGLTAEQKATLRALGAYDEGEQLREGGQ